jgi:hypothetical protein
MLAIFTKPLDTVTADDIAMLVTERWPEGYTVEFKKTLPESKGAVDPWITGSTSISNYARDKILSEVVAFANSQGGTLILGVDETNEKPPQASAVSALPLVGELARRFEDSARSCIDPPLPRLQVRGIETEPGKGVVAFRVGPSRSAPHRLSTTRHAYKRHGSSTMEMTMREIQDMTLNVARGLAGIAATFDRRRTAFAEWSERRAQTSSLIALRATAVPIDELPDPGHLPLQQGLFPALRTFVVAVRNEQIPVGVVLPYSDERPIIRGVARYADADWGGFRQELHQSGLADIWFGTHAENDPPSPQNAPGIHLLSHTNVIGAALSVIWSVDMLRTHVGMPDAEYALEVEISHFGPRGPQAIYDGFFSRFGQARHEIKESPLILPRIPVGPRSDIDRVVNMLDVDIYDALGVRRIDRTPLTVRL